MYSELDPFCQKWLANLQEGGHIPRGSILGDVRDIKPSEVGANFHAFAGIGGWAYALRLAGWPADVPVWTGSCPCQPFSVAGKRRGTKDKRHLWPEWRRLIEQCRPPIIFGEQTSSPFGRAWLDSVQTDLEALGYAVGAAGLPACSIGAPHKRQRIWFVAVAHDYRHGRQSITPGGVHGPGERRNHTHGRGTAMGDPLRDGPQTRGAAASTWCTDTLAQCIDGKKRPFESRIQPVAYGVPGRMGRLRAYGNAIVPQVAAEFIGATMDILKGRT